MSAAGRPLILSVGVSDAALSDPIWAARLIDLAETAMIDLLLLGEGARPPFDALVVAGWLAPRTRRVGLVPTLSTRRDEPFHAARALSALDFLTNGRAGWRPTTLGRPLSDDTLARGTDFVAATRSLWDSWDADALIIDQASGHYLDSTKVRRNNHRGTHFRVLGPLNAARPPQGHPVLVQGDSDPLWKTVSPDIVIIDRDSPAPPPGPKCLLRAYTALAGLDQIETLYREGLIDGVHLTLPEPLEDLHDFIGTMLPAMIERGMVQAGAPAGALRSRLGLAAAPHRFHPAEVE